MINTWTTTQPTAAARPCPTGTAFAAVSGSDVDARLRGTGLSSAERDGSTAAAADKGTIPSSSAWSPPV
jgi:hypothetical protein